MDDSFLKTIIESMCKNARIMGMDVMLQLKEENGAISYIPLDAYLDKGGLFKANDN